LLAGSLLTASCKRCQHEMAMRCAGEGRFARAFLFEDLEI